MAIFQKMDDEMFQGFLSKVQARRHLSAEAVRTISDGRVMNGSEAQSLGLIDQLGEMKAATDKIKRLANIRDANVVAYTASPDYNANVYASFESREPRPAALDDVVKALANTAGPRFLYLWAPGR
jgi:protease-4